MLPTEQWPILFPLAPQSLFYLLDFRNHCVCLTQLHCIDSNAQLLEVTRFDNVWEARCTRLGTLNARRAVPNNGSPRGRNIGELYSLPSLRDASKPAC